jgi:single-strand selective monofunctional uracil DNA glycosylase
MGRVAPEQTASRRVRGPTSRAALVEAAAETLARGASRLRFGPPVAHVYNPLVYARRSHAAYVARYANGRKRVVFLGMNPGPFGMAQTGVPFGAVEAVRGWLGIEAAVSRPRREHPRRPVQGFACRRAEVSGGRLWGAVAARVGTPGHFFAEHYVTSYCPLLFLEASGRNRTPDKLPVREQGPLFAACDRHLRSVVDALEPEWVVGIGRFAEARARAALADRGVRIGHVLHPSPANPKAQRGWGRSAERALVAQGVCRPGGRR